MLRHARLSRTGLHHRAGHDPLADDHGGDRLDALCAEALDLNRLASGFLRERLKNGGEPDRPRPEHDETIPSHGNIRGGDYYGNSDGESP